MGTLEQARQARADSISLAALSSERKNAVLAAIADALDGRREEIVAANAADVSDGEGAGVAPPLLKRLRFDSPKIDTAIAGIRSLIGLDDPVGATQSAAEIGEGLTLYRVACPIGVIGVVFESRPDALVQISSLCLKSGNSVLLKGGREAARTNRMLADVISEAGVSAGAPVGWLQLLETREDVAAMLTLDSLIDLIIPRGSNEFVRHIMAHSDIPVLGHADGICHVYVDKDAGLDMAAAIVEDAKCQYVAVCNAAETLLVHQDIADAFLPMLKQRLDVCGVVLRGCERTRAIIQTEAATDADWDTEYLDYVLSVRVIDDLDDAIAHINTHGSGHTDAIVTGAAATAARFMDRVDAGNVLWNCSTRFSDGFRYGLGAEVGISTNKIHARGPVGLDGLLIYKWKLVGAGHTVGQFESGERTYTHRHLDKAFEL